MNRSKNNAIQQRASWFQAILPDCEKIFEEARAQPRQIQHKGRVDLVTETDLAIEHLITESMISTFPTDSILAEESGQVDSGSAFRWILDPIDGTTNFSTGLEHYCISLALEVEGELELGFIFDPSRKRLFRAVRGVGSFLDEKQIAVSQTKALGHSLLATGFSYDRCSRPDNNVGEFDHMLRRCRGIRRMGAAALDFAYVAAGWLDGYWEYRLKPWDAAAGVLLVREAGGRVSGMRGQSTNSESTDFCVSNGLIHEQLLNALAASETIIGTGLTCLEVCQND